MYIGNAAFLIVIIHSAEMNQEYRRRTRGGGSLTWLAAMLAEPAPMNPVTCGACCTCKWHRNAITQVGQAQWLAHHGRGASAAHMWMFAFSGHASVDVYMDTSRHSHGQSSVVGFSDFINTLSGKWQGIPEGWGAGWLKTGASSSASSASCATAAAFCEAVGPSALLPSWPSAADSAPAVLWLCDR